MVIDVILNKGLYEVVAVVIARVHSQNQFLIRGGTGPGEYIRVELLGQELICFALVNQDRILPSAGSNQLGGVMIGPSFLICSQVTRERLDTPGTPGRRADRRKGGNRSVDLRVCQGERQRTVPPH